MFYVFILSEDSIVYSHSHVLFVQSVRRPWNFVYSPSHAMLVHSVGFIEIMYKGTISSCFYHFIIWAMHVYSVMHAINIVNSRKFHLFFFSLMHWKYLLLPHVVLVYCGRWKRNIEIQSHVPLVYFFITRVTWKTKDYRWASVQNETKSVLCGMYEHRYSGYKQ